MAGGVIRTRVDTFNASATPGEGQWAMAGSFGGAATRADVWIGMRSHHLCCYAGRCLLQIHGSELLVHHVQRFLCIMFRDSSASCSELSGSCSDRIRFRASCASCSVQSFWWTMFRAACGSCSELLLDHVQGLVDHVQGFLCIMFRASCASCCSGLLVHHVQGFLCIMFRASCGSCAEFLCIMFKLLVDHVQSFSWIMLRAADHVQGLNVPRHHQAPGDLDSNEDFIWQQMLSRRSLAARSGEV